MKNRIKVNIRLAVVMAAAALLLTMLLAGCGVRPGGNDVKPTDRPVNTDVVAIVTDAPSATDAPTVTDAPSATDVPAVTDAPDNTSVPAATATDAPAITDVLLSLTDTLLRCLQEGTLTKRHPAGIRKRLYRYSLTRLRQRHFSVLS